MAGDALRRARAQGVAGVIGFRVTSADVAGLPAHAAARRALAARGEADLARGAANVGTVAALTLAATAAADGAALASTIARLASFVVGLEPGRRRFVAAMIDAALAAQVVVRMEAGLSPLDRHIDGWMAEVALRPDDGTEAGAPEAAFLPYRLLTRYAAATHADDVDAVLLAVMPAMRTLTDAARRGERIDARFDAIQPHALALCVRFAETAADEAGARSVAVVLERTLRRRRPLAAAVLAARAAYGAG